MTASEFISKLQSLVEEHGDLEVLTWQEIGWASIENVRMVDAETLREPTGTHIFGID